LIFYSKLSNTFIHYAIYTSYLSKMARGKQTPLQMKKASEEAPKTSPKKRAADEADTESSPSPVKRRTTAGLPRAAETESNAVSYGRLDDNPDVSQPFSPT
jgi:hypothetical protein